MEKCTFRHVSCFKTIYQEHLHTNLYYKEPFFSENHFSDVAIEKFKWIKNQSEAKLVSGTLSITEEKQFINVFFDASLRMKFPIMFLNFGSG